MRKFVEKLDKLETVLMVGGMLISVLIIFMQVILRYVFNASLPWVEELARYLFIYFTWIGTSAAISADKHLRFEILHDKFPKAKKYLDVIGTVICLGMALFMLINGAMLIGTLLQSSAVSPTLRIPMWICYLAVPLGGLLMSIKYVYKLLYIDIAAIRKGAAA